MAEEQTQLSYIQISKQKSTKKYRKRNIKNKTLLQASV
jgi:hypothetical protein